MKRKNRILALIGLLVVAVLFESGPFSSRMPSAAFGDGVTDWPQWRGPNRDGFSHETGFLKSWPEGGPRIIWQVPVGEGFSGISISHGRVYTMYTEGKDEFVACLDASNGGEIWRFRSDKAFPDGQGGNGPRSTPTVDGDLVFALSAYGKLYALDAKYGKKVWGHDLTQEFGGEVPRWGYSESILIEGNLLFVVAGAQNEKSIVALNKKSGEVVWTSQKDKAAYASPIAITVNGIRQVIFFTAKAAISLSPTDGQLYWRYPWQTSHDVNAAMPVFIPPDKVFISSGYDKGAAVLQIRRDLNKITVEPIWETRVMKNKFASSVLYGDYLYGFNEKILKCIEANTGVEQWKTRGFGMGTLMLADGHLIVLGDSGKLALVEATPSTYKEKASAQVLSGRCWTVPTLAGGKLYVRNQKEMMCLELTGGI